MDIPQDICTRINEFDTEYSDKLLGPEWQEFLFCNYEEFREKSQDEEKNEELFKAKFSKQVLAYFYDAMNYVFRDGFNTGSKTIEKAKGWVAGLLFGKE